VAHSAAKTWLMSLGFAAAFIALGAGVYWGVRNWKARPAGQGPITLENPKSAAAPPETPKERMLERLIEVTGVRLTQNAKKATEARALVVNHSPASIADLAGTVTLRPRGDRTAAPSGTFSFKVPSLGPYESKEVTAVLDTKLRIYELPDWQNMDAELRITSPQ
jgi:hypothetical protein